MTDQGIEVTKPYLDKLKAAQERFDAECDALGEMIREELIVPVCKKHKLTFTCGMGTFGFERKCHKKRIGAPNYGEAEDLYRHPPIGYGGLSKQAKADLEPILHLLNEEVSHGQYVGYFVADVE